MLAYDMIERLIDFAGAEFGDKILRQARRAMQGAIRAWPSLHRWTYGYTYGRLQLNASYTTGTVAYTSSTRTLTLTGGTFPTWAATGGAVRIGEVVARVATRTDATHLILDSVQTFGADIAAGSVYSIFRDTYDLPADFVYTDNPIQESWFSEMQFVKPQAWAWQQRTSDNAGTPRYYTFFPSKIYPGRYEMHVFPYPDADRTLDMIYSRRLRSVVYDGFENYDGQTASITALGTTVTGVGTNFKSAMVGSYIRLASDGLLAPTSLEGNNPRAFESKITAVASTTSLTVADAAVDTLTGSKLIVADLLDIEDGVMQTALVWQSLKLMAQELRMKDSEAIAAQAQMSLVAAREADSRVATPRQVEPGQWRRPSIRHMPSGPDE